MLVQDKNDRYQLTAYVNVSFNADAEQTIDQGQASDEDMVGD